MMMKIIDPPINAAPACQSPHPRWVRFLALEKIVTRIQQIEVAGDTFAWHRCMGAALVVLVVLLFLSGAFLALNYSPVPGAAYDSVDFTLYSTPFGSIIKGVHHYAWNALLIVAILHLGQTLIAGAYRKPRQLTWISGVILLVVLPLFIITGDLLPWDQTGYWSTQVRLSIIASVPLVGDWAVDLMQGGPLTGIVALTRFYVLHMLFLPGLLIILLAVHVHFIVQHGLAQRRFAWQTTAHRIPFWPRAVNRWLFIFVTTLALIGLIAWYWPPSLGDPADPTDSTYIPKPEWWVLFLNQLVAIFRGNWAVLGTTVIPGVLVTLLMALPYLDRSVETRFVQRKWILLLSGAVAAAILILSVMGYLEHFGSPHG